MIEASAAEAGTLREWSPPLNRMAITILSLLGILVATYLLLANLGLTGPVVCGVGDCETVQASSYARIAGVPVSAVGLVGYLLLFGLGLLGLQPAFGAPAPGKRTFAWGPRFATWIPLLLVAGSTFGVLFTGYLTYIEAFVLHAWCRWCVVSAVLITLIFFAAVPELGRIRRPRG